MGDVDMSGPSPGTEKPSETEATLAVEDDHDGSDLSSLESDTVAMVDIEEVYKSTYRCLSSTFIIMHMVSLP
jgi:hypothetical protein